MQFSMAVASHIKSRYGFLKWFLSFPIIIPANRKFTKKRIIFIASDDKVKNFPALVPSDTK